MRARVLQTTYTGLLMAAWSIEEARLASEYGAGPRLGLAVALWATAWFLGARLGMDNSKGARGRRLASLASALLAAVALLLDPLLGPGAPYWLLTLASSLALSTLTTAITREEYDASWPKLMALARGGGGVVQALVLLSLALMVESGDPRVPVAAALVLAPAAIVSHWDPLVSPTFMRLLDKFTEAAVGIPPGRSVSSSLARMAAIVGSLAAAKLAVLPPAVAEYGPIALAAYAAGLALGSIAATQAPPSPRGLALIALAGLAGAIAWEDYIVALVAYSMALGYGDTGLLLWSLRENPSGAPRYTTLMLAWLLTISITIALASSIGLGYEPILVASILIGILLSPRRISWS